MGDTACYVDHLLVYLSRELSGQSSVGCHALQRTEAVPVGGQLLTP